MTTLLASDRTWPTSGLRPNPLNPRTSAVTSALDDMVASMRIHGVLQPLLVTPSGTIVAGHRRHAAALLAGLTEVPVVVRALSEADQLAAMLSENVQREDLSPLEEARAYAGLGDLGVPQSEISRRTGVSAVRVNERLAILRLDPAVQEMFGRSELPITLVRVLVQVEDPAMQRRLATLSAKRRLTVKQLNDIVKTEQQVRNGAQRPFPTPKAVTGEPDQSDHEGTVPEAATRSAALARLQRDPGANVSARSLMDAMDDVCTGLCADCGMASIEAVCRECPLPRLILRVLP